MSTFVQKIVLIFLSLYLPSVYAMKRTNSGLCSKKEATWLLYQEVKNAQKNDNFSPETWQNIRKYLEQGANPYCRVGRSGTQLFMLAIQYLKKDLIDFLLQQPDFNINMCDSDPLDYVMGMLPVSPPEEIIDIRTGEIIDICKSLLQYGANPNGAHCPLDLPLFRVVKYGNNDLLKLFIAYNADVNKKDFWGNVPLTLIGPAQDSLEKIETICDARARLCNVDRSNNTIFHVAINNKLPKGYIEKFITHARFDVENESVKKTIIETFLVFKKLRIQLPKELRSCILLYITQVNKHVQSIQKILEIKNKDKITALQLLCSKYPHSGDLYVKEVKSLLDGTELENDYYEFKETFLNTLKLAPNNLVSQIYARILEK